MYNENGIYRFTSTQFTIAKENGISKQLLYNRVNKLGWDVARAISEPVNKQGQYSKIYSKEEKEIALSNGVSIQLLWERLNRGWEKCDAINIPPYGRRKRNNGNKVARH